MKRFSAERPRFELGRPFRSLHAFQACLLSHSSTSPWLIFPSEKGFLTSGTANIGIFLNIEKSLSVSGGNFRPALRATIRSVLRAPNPDKPCPLLRLRWFSGHQIPTNRARCSAPVGCPDTKSRQTVPAAPPRVVIRTPNPGKSCPPLRLGRLSGHQISANRARCSASGGYPDTKSREIVPAAPPRVMVRKGRRVSWGTGQGRAILRKTHPRACRASASRRSGRSGAVPWEYQCSADSTGRTVRRSCNERLGGSWAPLGRS